MTRLPYPLRDGSSSKRRGMTLGLRPQPGAPARRSRGAEHELYEDGWCYPDEMPAEH